MKAKKLWVLIYHNERFGIEVLPVFRVQRPRDLSKFFNHYKGNNDKEYIDVYGPFRKNA